MHQSNIRERNQQVRQMRRIYQKAKAVIIWMGPDTPDGMATRAADSIRTVSNYLITKLNLTIDGLSSRRNVYQEVLYQNRHILPAPNACPDTTEASWQSLIWFYSHLYFTRLWVIQEVNASSSRMVHCGHENIEWDRVDLVAGYIIMDTAFTKRFGFSETHCWWASIITTERMRNPRNWLAMLYLASNFSCLDNRDMIFALRGLMHLSEGTPQAALLNPDYAKSTLEVYRDSVEAALHDFQNTDVLLYLVGDEVPSWVPRWDRPMLFRNPFRFGKALPWKPAGESYPAWKIDKEKNSLRLSGFVVDVVSSVATYNERVYSNALLNDEGGRSELRKTWHTILEVLHQAQHQRSASNACLPLSQDLLTAAAMSLSYGLDADANPASEYILLHNFVAYLRLILSPDAFAAYIPDALQNGTGDGHAFGKPVWDFSYPDSGFFVTQTGLVGCSVWISQAGDIVGAMLGSTYPFVLRPQDDHYLIRGYSYVHSVMHGERQGSEIKDFEMR